jgi:hypothetical protein
MPTSGRVRKSRQRTEEFFKSTCVASSNSTNIESVEFFLDLNTLMFDKYEVILLPYI